jgi:hypothetical protein
MGMAKQRECILLYTLSTIQFFLTKLRFIPIYYRIFATPSASAARLVFAYSIFYILF